MFMIFSIENIPAHLDQPIISSLIIIGAYIFGIVLSFFTSRILTRLAKKTALRWDDALIDSTGKWIPFWATLISLYLLLLWWDLSPKVEEIITWSLTFLFGISLVFVIYSFTSKLADLYSGGMKKVVPQTSLFKSIIKISILAIAILVFLNFLGVPIAPILATLGIGGLAVALALQDTLSNLFSGFYIILGKQIRVNDFVKLESGEQGYVLDIGWRSTRIKMLPNNTVVIPNSKLSQSVVHNYYLPEKELAVLVQVGVHYDSNLEDVERITIEVAKEVLSSTKGGVTTFEPFIRYHTFDDFSINFTVILRAKEFVDNYLIKHEFIKKLHTRFNKEGIIIPYPIRAINNTQEKIEAASIS